MSQGAPAKPALVALTIRIPAELKDRIDRARINGYTVSQVELVIHGIELALAELERHRAPGAG